MSMTAGVHWWRFSTPSRQPEEVLDRVAAHVPGGWANPETSPAYNQPFRSLHDSGLRVHFGSADERQPVVVDVPGEACERIPPDALADAADELGGSVTRFDVAMDFDLEAEPVLLEMRDAYRSGRCNTRWNTRSMVEMKDHRPGGGATVEFGSRSSELHLVCYTRRGPLRVEARYTTKDRLARRSLPQNLKALGPVGMWRTFASRCIFPFDWYEIALAGPTADLARTPRREPEIDRTIDHILASNAANLAAIIALGRWPEVARRLVIPDKLSADQEHRFRRFVAEERERGNEAGAAKLEAELSRCKRSR